MFNDPPQVPWFTALGEAYRVLRPGGKILCVLPAKYNAAKWQDLLMPWRTWFRKTPKGPPRFTRRELYEGFSDFRDVKVYKRHLRRSELPYLWRWMMLPVAERLMGRFFIVKGFKPLTAARPFAPRPDPIENQSVGAEGAHRDFEPTSVRESGSR